MTDQTVVRPVVTPWHLWLVGTLAVMWNSVGVFDFVMTETQNASYMSAFTPEQLAYFHGFPVWVVVVWGVAVWGGLLGSVLLLLRMRLAVPVFGVSLATLLLTSYHNFVLTDGLAIMGGAGALIFTTVIFVIAVALLVYATSLTRKGVLH